MNTNSVQISQRAHFPLISGGRNLLSTIALFQLFVIDNCIDDWRIAVSCRTFFQIAVELLVCVIHPPPLGSHYFVWRTVHADGETVTTPQVSLKPCSQQSCPWVGLGRDFSVFGRLGWVGSNLG